MEEASKIAIEEWLDGRPEIIKQLAKEFPLGTCFQLKNGSILWLIGYNEDGMLLVTHLSPLEDYDLAIENRVAICAKHFREGASLDNLDFEMAIVEENGIRRISRVL